ncbi:fructose-specific PTS transporter subunit EIIC [Jeongeupia naejangsanensis]|uniref:protein-N(pi)-phosphohistidine--D-fructose phosphotransferase n=1 Tax=Jeongeupia naejangsanensis TaxID=613195 RepID=A0ABS2BHI6_9NEIS|nr:fructose-specific PTS transporter subunit EIIC [Jeongeupia naejangsanensis]MBM3115079.1 PTS transporter subunit EIIC [Jeongeupia naejangsanensis]
MSRLSPSLVAVVASRDGLTRPLMAAEALARAADTLKFTLNIEVRTRLGVQQVLSGDELRDAHGVIVAADDDVDLAPYQGKQIYKLGLDEAITGADAVLGRIAPAAPAVGVPDVAVAAVPKVLKIVAITSCPTGIAHTFMAAEGLQAAAAKLGHEIHVETQGSVGAQSPMSAQQILDADLVIIAADAQVDLGRFGGKRVFETGTKRAINNGVKLIEDAIAGAAVQGAAPPKQGLADEAAEAKKARNNFSGPYKHLMTGVSFMLPFVVAGGLLIAVAFALGGIYAFDDAHKGTLAWTLFQIGAKSAFALMIPVLSGYIAYSIADRPGITPGMVGGMLAGAIGAGFLGGIISGFLAGYITLLLNRHIRLHRNLEGLKPVLILPLFSTLIVGLLMMYVVGEPVAMVLHAMETWLKGMQAGSALALGAIIGAMMAFDMGGPVNKAAYAFSAGLIASQIYTPMAAAMVAGMTPPLGIALACWLFRNRFTAEDRDAGKAAAVLGIAFITEGAIPFAARDPLRVIPSCMLGSAVAGAISLSAGAELKVPHGGVFVLPIPNAITHLGMYLVALLAGTVVTALALWALKKPIRTAAA